MAETTSTTPDYSLDAATIASVGAASAGGEEAMDAYLKSVTAGSVSAGITTASEEFYQARADKEARNEAAAQVKISGAAKWDEAFDAMGERGAWASPELYDQFMAMEEGYKAEYLEAVRTGDKKEQSRLLKEQGARSASLQSWKGTMETAAEINKEYGWGEIMNGNSEEAVANRGILEAIAKNDGTAKAVVDPDTGEIGFTVGEVDEFGQPLGRVWTRREIDEMVATGTAPVVRQESFMTASIELQNLGIEGKPFQKEAQHYANLKAIKKELRANEKAGTSILRDVWAGETSLEADLREAILAPGTGIQFSVTIPKGQEDIDLNKDGVFTEADLIDEFDDMWIDTIIDHLEYEPDLLAEIAADWMTMKQEISHAGGLKEYNKTKSLTMFANMTKEQKNALSSEELLQILMGVE